MHPELDMRLAELATAQHGVVHRRQLAALGFGDEAIKTRVRRARLLRLHRGVYAVGHRSLSREGRWTAAVLACGPGAALSHHSAATAWGLRPGWGPITDVTVPSTAGRTAPSGVRLHRVATLGPRDTRRLGALRVTSPERTLEDLAAHLSPARLGRAIDEAEARGLLARPLRTARLPGAAALRAAMEGRRVTGSDLEAEFLALLARAGLPRPRTNVVIGPYTVDVLFPEHALVVELDGFAHHRTRASFAADRARDRRLKALGYDVVRFTDADALTREAADDLAVLLRRE
jgi:very-short-patch-repair endonuclease